MSNYFSDGRFYEVGAIFACRENDFTVFVGKGLIDGINDYHGFFLPVDYPMPDYTQLPEQF